MDDFHAYLDRSVLALTLHDVTTQRDVKTRRDVTHHDDDADGPVAGFAMYFPTPLSRSAKPLYLGE